MNLKAFSPFNGRLNTHASLLLILGLLIIFAVKNIFFSCESVAVVDVKKIKAQFIRQLAERKASDVNISHAGKRFNNALKKSLEDYALTHHATLVQKDAVLGFDKKPKDATFDIMKAIAIQMKRGRHD